MGLFEKILRFFQFGRVLDRQNDEAYEPWKGRQFSPTDDPNDRPEGDRFASWDEAFNRPITDVLSFKIEYVDRDGTLTERIIEPRSIHLLRSRPDLYIRAFCHLRGSMRVFYSPRITKCLNLQSNRNLTDLGQYLRRDF